MDIRLKNIKEIDNYLSQTTKDFIGYLSDKEIPLEVRWASFEEYGHHLGNLNTSCHSYGPIDLCCIYNPPDRYRTYMYSEDIENLEAILFLYENEEPSNYSFSFCTKALEDVGIFYKEDQDVAQWNSQIKEFIDGLKEEILASGSSGFVYDW